MLGIVPDAGVHWWTEPGCSHVELMFCAGDRDAELKSSRQMESEGGVQGCVPEQLTEYSETWGL